jgi:hypothetical protein
VQVCVTPHGQCVHRSKAYRAYRGWTQDKATIDSSWFPIFLSIVPQALMIRTSGERSPPSEMSGSLAQVRKLCFLRQTCRRAPRGRPETGKRSSDPDWLLIETFLGRGKILNGVCHEIDRGDVKTLSPMIWITIAMKKWHFCRRTLRRVNEELVKESDSEHNVPRESETHSRRGWMGKATHSSDIPRTESGERKTTDERARSQWRQSATEQ